MLRDTMESGLRLAVKALLVAALVGVGAMVSCHAYQDCRATGLGPWLCYRLVLAAQR
jgi:hypothetical protein